MLNSTECVRSIEKNTYRLLQAPTYPWATRNEVLGVAYPWVGVQGVACQVGAEGEAGLRSLVVLGDAGPSQVAHGALAWEAFLRE